MIGAMAPITSARRNPLLVALPFAAVASADFKEGSPLPFVKVGEFTFASDYGEVRVTPEDLDQIVSNFERNARRQDIPVLHGAPLLNEEHTEVPEGVDPDTYIGPGAIGFIKQLYRDGDTVYAVPDYNALGDRLMEEDRYRGVSPELLLNWTDPETMEEFGMTAVGLALTNRPRMKALAVQGRPLDPDMAASEPARVLAFMEAQDVHIDRAMTNFSVAYAYPSKKRLPLHTAEAVKGARARFMTVEATEEEREAAWGLVLEAAKAHQVDVPASWRELKASESAALLMAEGDGDDWDMDLAAGMQPPCAYQPPFGSCPGYTRSDPDGDGDADCCALAARGCNGYLPMGTRASLIAPQAAAMYGEQAPEPEGAEMTQRTNPPASPQTPPPTAPPPAPATAPAPAALNEPQTPPAPAPAPATPPAPAEPSQAAPDPQGAANMAELQSMFAAEQRRNRELAERVEASEKQNKEMAGTLRAMTEANKLADVSRRFESLVKTGRLTPAERDRFSEKFLHFAENPWLLEAYEAREANSAIDLSERGSGEPPDPEDDDNAGLHQQALQLMSERKQGTDMKDDSFYQNYRAALTEASARRARKNRLGFRG